MSQISQLSKLAVSVTVCVTAGIPPTTCPVPQQPNLLLARQFLSWSIRIHFGVDYSAAPSDVGNKGLAIWLDCDDCCYFYKILTENLLCLSRDPTWLLVLWGTKSSTLTPMRNRGEKASLIRWETKHTSHSLPSFVLIKKYLYLSYHFLCSGVEGIPGQCSAWSHLEQGRQLGLSPGLDGRP